MSAPVHRYCKRPRRSAPAAAPNEPAAPAPDTSGDVKVNHEASVAFCQNQEEKTRSNYAYTPSGLEANKTIEAGQVVLRDYPLHQTNGTSPNLMITLLKQLLQNPQNLEPDSFKGMPGQRAMFEKFGVSANDRLELEDLQKEYPERDVLRWYFYVCMTNVTTVYGADGDNKAKMGFGLFTILSKINHHCKANCVIHTDLRSSGVIVYSLIATRDIQPGEPLTLNYFGPECPEEVSGTAFLRKFFTPCVCTYCTRHANYCSNCGKNAGCRCKRCKGAWYCCLDCQKAHWKKHKLDCKMK